MGNSWTAELRARQAAMIHLEPWERSTGAKTAAGKARSSRNAYKPGSSFNRRMQELKQEAKALVSQAKEIGSMFK